MMDQRYANYLPTAELSAALRAADEEMATASGRAILAFNYPKSKRAALNRVLAKTVGQNLYGAHPLDKPSGAA